MPDPQKSDPKSKPRSPKQSTPRPAGPPTPGRAKRGSDFRDHDQYDAPVEDPDDPVAE